MRGHLVPSDPLFCLRWDVPQEFRKPMLGQQEQLIRARPQPCSQLVLKYGCWFWLDRIYCTVVQSCTQAQRTRAVLVLSDRARAVRSVRSVSSACWMTCQHYSHSLLVHGHCCRYLQAFSIAAFILSSAVVLLQLLDCSTEQLLWHQRLLYCTLNQTVGKNEHEIL